MDVTKKPGPMLRKQPVMRRVVAALLPCVAGAVYFFGWRSLLVVAWAAAVGFVVELIFTRSRREPVSEAVFVTTTIFALIMPPTVPWHVLTIGTIFAVMFAKEVFGGFGRNIFNPAMAGRCFVYVCFPVALTGTWAPAAPGLRAGLTMWTTATSPDAVTGATPVANLKAGKLVAGARSGGEVSTVIPFKIGESEQVNVAKSTLYKALLIGRISGTMGVTSVILILIGGLYLFYTRTADRSIILSLVISYAVLNQVLYWFDVKPVQDALIAVLSGGFLFGAFFMATDPVSAPRTAEAKIIYGVLIAVFTTTIRNFSIFNGGLMFSILIGNMFAPILDYAVKSYKSGRERRAAA
ncbi:MAG TPA: RnfABCDGE type electron transport complex subunit D [Sedimentisphaerales bacterium]|nr:RnfABCDGE type electron transport complex subunit D [Sedimentisphaerales bacterium]